MSGLGPAELAEVEQVAIEVALTAARFICAERPGTVEVAATKTSDVDVVTVMDTGSEQLLRERLGQLRPRDGILGEEETWLAGTSGLTWVVDPIDGTVNYLYDLPTYAVSVALVEGDPTVPGRWQPVAGAVAAPRLGEIFHARRGAGAWRRPLPDGPAGRAHVQRLAVRHTAELAQALVGTGFAYDRGIRGHQGEVAARLLPQVRDLRRLGSAALDLAFVAAGRLDGYYEQGLQPWDLAAGWLLVEEAGGQVSGATADAPPSAAMVLAAAPTLHHRLRSVLTTGG